VTDLVNAGFLVLSVILATSRAQKVQLAGAATAWGLGLVGFGIRGLIQ
jgi:hypothetical protein